MSKYYKAEDVINAIEDKIAEYIPTLYGRYAEIPLELRMAIEHLPTIEVSEDCISRAELLKDFGCSELTRKYGGDHSGYGTYMLYEIQDIIEDAPSVVPTTEQSSEVGEWIKVALEAHIVPAEDVKNDVDIGWNLAIDKALEIVDTVSNDVGDKVTLENE